MIHAGFCKCALTLEDLAIERRTEWMRDAARKAADASGVGVIGEPSHCHEIAERSIFSVLATTKRNNQHFAHKSMRDYYALKKYSEEAK